MNTLDVKDAQSAAAPSTFTVATTHATVFTLAKGEVGFIQNLDDAALAVKLGASAATDSFSMILQAGTAADDGKGGFTYITDYVGPVSVIAMSGTARYIAWKRVLG
jgi:hypothetical protein